MMDGKEKTTLEKAGILYLEGAVSNVRTMADKSLRVQIDLQELPAGRIAELFELYRNGFVGMLLGDSNDVGRIRDTVNGKNNG